MIKSKRTTTLLFLFLLFLNNALPATSSISIPKTKDNDVKRIPLSYTEISSLRVREIKRRLARNHGFSSDELSRMLDKKELVEALAFEEHKEFQKLESERNRETLKKGIMGSIFAVLVVLFWPLLMRVWEVAEVNFVVYTDKKKYEISQCVALRSFLACVGILLLAVLDFLSLWLSFSVLLSWILPKNKYMFPFIPNIPIRPAALLSGQPNVQSNPLASYGINVGPMMITWGLRFVTNKVECWTAKVLSKAQRSKEKKARKKKKKEERTEEEKEEKEARRKKRREEKEAKAKLKKMEEEKQQEWDKAVNEPVQTSPAHSKESHTDKINSTEQPHPDLSNDYDMPAFDDID